MKADVVIITLFATAVVFPLFLQNVAALTIAIDVKESFTTGEIVYFNYTLLSPINEELTYVPYVICPSAPNPAYNIESILIEAGQPASRSYNYMKVSDSFGPQKCKSGIRVLSPLEMTEEKFFSISTTPIFDFNTVVCEDHGCNQRSKVFVKGYNIYIDYESSVPDVLVTSSLKLPNGEIRNLDLPANITAGETGTYTLMTMVSKEGYTTITESSQFAVIEKEAQISTGEFTSPPWWIGFGELNIVYVIAAALVLAVIVAAMLSMRAKMRGATAEPHSANRF